MAVCFTDLLTGVAIGMAVGVIFILRTNLRNPYFYAFEHAENSKIIRIRLAEEVSLLNKGAIQYTLTHLPKDSSVIIDGTQAKYVDPDVLEIIDNFKENAHTKGISVKLEGICEKYEVPSLKELVYKQPEKIN